MHFRLDVRPETEGWSVRVFAPDGQLLTDESNGEPLIRHLRSTGPSDAPTSFPLPPESEADDLDPDTLDTTYTALMSRAGSKAEVEAFGQYLFRTLIGDRLWSRLQERFTADCTELALGWPAADPVLNRLPWEMMHDGKTFLAFRPDVALTRRIDFDGAFESELDTIPKVLFVVGSGLNDDVIRPGAEYMALIQNLSLAGLETQLQTRILVQATEEKLEAGLMHFRPSVVHFICHGWFGDEHRSYLALYDKDAPNHTVPVYGDRLLQLLKTKDNLPLPPVVVLNACYTANLDMPNTEGEPAVPLAAELVAGGVPIVVGMAGQVADQACRLFTRRFYEALLTDGNLALAAAEGRRAASRHGDFDPGAVDWALPTLFIGDSVEEPKLSFKTEPWRTTWHKAAQPLGPGAFPPFCDRFGVLEKYHVLLADEAEQKRITGTSDFLQVLAYQMPEGYPESQPGPRYGCTWQLRDFATKAACGGHVFVLIDNKFLRPDKPFPTRIDEFLSLVSYAIEYTTIQFELNDFDVYGFTDRLLGHPEGAPPPADLPGELKRRWNEGATEPNRLARALRLDLLRLLEHARARRPEADRPNVRLLLLVDDLHRMGNEVASFFLKSVLGPFGLQQAARDVRAAIGYAASAQGHHDAIKKITDWLSETPWAVSLPLQSFEGPEELLAYKYFLFNWHEPDEHGHPRRKRLVPVPPVGPHRAHVDWFFATFSRKVQGVPSYLMQEAEDLIKTFGKDMQEHFGFSVLREARDDELFELPNGEDE